MKGQSLSACGPGLKSSFCFGSAATDSSVAWTAVCFVPYGFQSGSVVKHCHQCVHTHTFGHCRSLMWLISVGSSWKKAEIQMTISPHSKLTSVKI